MDIEEQIKALKEAKRRRQQALNMFRSGKTHKEIGEEFGVTRQRAKQLVDKAITENATK